MRAFLSPGFKSLSPRRDVDNLLHSRTKSLSPKAFNVHILPSCFLQEKDTEKSNRSNHFRFGTQEAAGKRFAKEQAETIVSAITALSTVSLDTIYKDMVTQAQQKMKIELDQVKQQLMIRAENKLDINLERSRVTDMDSSTNSSVTEVSNKIDTEIAALKTLMESNKLDTIRYLAASVFTCLAIALGFYRFWK
ncbi:hypothetical protein JD844_033533 [Phrynosoma platyrhinos]|uniref:Coiled-coil domain-containing protein 90B, mitochondrial n=1 Tax=Phrynosoma platyrhinos TaxID=52577 RepID=A0ABQ7T6L0_PHRPL|nr:hypothetical protein JD844_033533 [Phrynosoma platyrhinos]